MSSPAVSREVRQVLRLPLTGQVLSTVFALLFLFLCMILPLVGKSAVYGSGSPGAGPMDTLWKNHLFFTSTLLLTLCAGGATLVSKWMRWREDGVPFPKFTAGLLGLTAALGVCYVAGLLKL